MPEAVPKKAKKLSGKACSLWVHIRNFPLVVKDFLLNNDDVDSDDEVLIWVLKLVDIVNRITATEFRTMKLKIWSLKLWSILMLEKRSMISIPMFLERQNPSITSLATMDKQSDSMAPLLLTGQGALKG